VKEPSARQLQALVFIWRFMLRFGFAPTCRELSEHLGYAGVGQGVKDIIAALIKKGMLVQRGPPRSSRTVIPTAEGRVVARRAAEASGPVTEEAG
jgi:hypothetical protein